MRNVFSEVKAERKDQIKENGNDKFYEPVDYCAAITQAIGSAAGNAVDSRWKNISTEMKGFPDHVVDRARLLRYRNDLLKVAALTIRAIERIDGTDLKDDDENG